MASAIEQAKDQLEVTTRAPVADGEDPTLWLPDELLLLILVQAALIEGSSVISLVCQRWWRLCQDRCVKEAGWEGRWELYAAGKRKPRSFNFDETLQSLCAGINDTIYCGTREGPIQVRSAEDGSLVQTLIGHDGRVSVLAVDLDGNLYSASEDCSIRMWSGETGAHIRTLSGHSGMVYSLAVNQANLFSCGEDRTIRVWECSTGDLVHTMTNFEPLALALGNHGQLYSGLSNGTIQVWSATDYTLLRSLKGHTMCIFALVVNKKGTLFSGSWDYTVRVWSGTDGTLLRTLEGHTCNITSLAVAPDGTLFSTADDGTIRLWRGRMHKAYAIPYHAFHVMGVLVFAQDGCLWAYDGSPDGNVFKY